MEIATLENVTIGFGGPSLLEGVSCRINTNDRIGLLGRNGAGKTTFMRMLAGLIEPDSGKLHFEGAATVSLLQQDVPGDLTGTIEETVAMGIRDAPDLDHHDDAWKSNVAVNETISRMQLDPSARFETLSSGMKRRVLLARAIVSKPDLLSLDEPTNHWISMQSNGWKDFFLSGRRR